MLNSIAAFSSLSICFLRESYSVLKILFLSRICSVFSFSRLLSFEGLTSLPLYFLLEWRVNSRLGEFPQAVLFFEFLSKVFQVDTMWLRLRILDLVLRLRSSC